MKPPTIKLQIEATFTAEDFTIADFPLIEKLAEDCTRQLITKVYTGEPVKITADVQPAKESEPIRIF